MTTLVATPPRLYRVALERLDLSQLKQLAELSGAPYQTLYNVRSGKTLDPRASTCLAIASHYHAIAQARPTRKSTKVAA